MVFMSLRRKQGRKVSFDSNKRIFTTVTSNLNSSKLNDQNTCNSDNVIGNSNLPRININTKL